MDKLFITAVDFLAFNLYYALGFFNAFLIPMCAEKYGGAAFLCLFMGVVLLFGIPAFAEECSYLMADDSRKRSPMFKKWLRCYEAISMMQITQLAISEGHSKLMVAMTQFATLIDSRSPELMSLYSPNCRMNSARVPQGNGSSVAVSAPEVTITQWDDDLEKLERRLLQPSCLVRDRSEVACRIHALFSDPGSIMYYTVFMLTLVILLYAIIFGRSMLTYGAMGRVYIALVVLCICTLLLHFVGRPLSSSAIEADDSHRIKSFEVSLTHALLYSSHSLGVMGFSISILGSRAGKPVKQNFVALSIVICLADTLIACAFTGLSYLRNAAVRNLCNSDIATDEFMSMPDVTRALLNSSRFVFKEASLRGAVQVSESVLMFRETSGSVPWTVYLPFQVLFMLLSTMLVCAYLLTSDFQALRLLNRRPRLMIVLVLLRFAAVICIHFLSLSNQARYLESYMWISVQLCFPVVKIFDCISIHLSRGFSEFLEDRRRLLPSKKTVQRFIYNWYIAPTSVFLYHIGYPLMLLILITFYSSTVQTISFCEFFCLFNVLPIILIVLGIYYYG